MKMQERNFVTIQGWMRTELDLKGNDLLVYAIIYGFSQTSEQKFTGSLQYLADWCGATKQGIQKNLKSLIDKGLIKKEILPMSGVYNLVAYYTTELHGYTTELHGGIQLSCINNISNTKKDNKEKEDISKDISKKKEFSLKHSKQDSEFNPAFIVELYRRNCTRLPKLRAMSDKRKVAVEKIYKQYGIDIMQEVFRIANDSAFLTGDNDRGWKADFDFIMREDKFIAILEGKYNTKSKKIDRFCDEGLNTCLTRKGPRKEIDKSVKRKTY